MADIKFGIGQTANPTPSKINLWVRIYTIVASIFLAWMSTNNLIGPITQGYISSIIGLTLLLVNGLAPLFGIDVNGNTRIPAKDVSAMDSDTPLPYSAPKDKTV